MVDTKTQYLKIKSEVDLAISRVIESSQFIQGPIVHEFEANVSDYLKCRQAIGCASGTDALQIAMMALDIQPGDEIITTPFTFVATTETIALLGAKPVYVDIDPKTFNIDVIKIEEKITSKTKAIMPVHLYGQPADMSKILDIAKAYKLFVIEDAAQAMGAEYKGQKICTMGDIGCISFYPSKNLGAFGDGGMLSTNDEELGSKIRMITSHGSKTKYYHEILGVNSRLDSIQAAILNVKLKHLDEYCDARLAAAEKYNDRFDGIFDVPFIIPGVKHIFHQYSIRVKNRDRMQEFLRTKGIPSMIYYPVPLHLQKAYKYDYNEGDYPVTEEIAKDIISLPMHTELTDEQIEYISEKVIEFNNK
ncbi:MAG: DegT/DnrJ/EryC1/StrS family aminotransferase [Ignavibacteria bacterium]|nr:DegT/DnrJ/EryC1/StrS family aminotransferase [Ignavibacteria bacterium]MCC7159089.1 DegT/DnrJ/EryC1/StrS family aminotransferase [Ignavibacteria bacterium]